MRARVGSVVRRKGRGKGAKPTWWARVTYTDLVTGKRHDRQRRAENKVDAGDKVHELLAEVDATGGRSLAKEHMTFLDLATYFEKQYLKPAEYVDGKKKLTKWCSPFFTSLRLRWAVLRGRGKARIGMS